MENSHIEWCDHTWNPWIGCTKVSAGCAHCYAEARDIRFSGGLHWGNGAPRQRTSAGNWREPLKWNREAALSGCGDCDPCLGGRPDQCAVDPSHRPRVFCASLADWLDDEVPIEWLADMIDVILLTPNLDWLLLTKRPQKWRQRLEEVWKLRRPLTHDLLSRWLLGEPPSNVWIGTSVENQQCADQRIPELLKIPARVRFLSCEPLLGPAEFSNVTNRSDAVAQLGKKALGGIHWVIVGGESGTGARPCNLDWIRSIVTQCRAAGVAPFVKQVGRAPIENLQDAYVGGEKICDACEVPMELNDKKGGDMAEWPPELRVREFPK